MSYLKILCNIIYQKWFIIRETSKIKCFNEGEEPLPSMNIVFEYNIITDRAFRRGANDVIYTFGEAWFV